MKSSIYIHWPFCEKKCPYCDFNSHVREKISQNDYVAAYIKEINHYKKRLGNIEVTSVFFGGGTPSLMSGAVVQEILGSLKDSFSFVENCEVTLEANPGSTESLKFREFAQAGINRLSIGVQSFDDGELKFLGRIHGAEEAKRAINIAKDNFENFNFDLIYALPDQKLEAWQKNLQTAMEFAPKHISLYQLTIEKGTDFYSAFKKGKFKEIDGDLATEMYEYTDKFLAEYGIFKYEISNYAKDGYECRHNANYWRYGNYLGIGAGAHGRFWPLHGDINSGKVANFDIHSPENWLKKVQETGVGVQEETHLSQQEIIEEFMFMATRTKWGLDKAEFAKQTGVAFENVVSGELAQALENEGLAASANNSFCLTNKGMMLHGSVMKKIFGLR